MKKIKKKILSTLMIGVLTLGSLGALSSFKEVPDVEAVNYENLSPTIALTTAYYDAYSGADNSKDANGSKSKAFRANIQTILGTGNSQFGGVGLLIGPRSESAGGNASDMMTNPNSLSELQIRSNAIFPKDAAEKYLAFGQAVHNLNNDAAKMSTNDARVEESIDGIANSARKLSGIGMQLLSDYNPAPIVSAFYDSTILTDPAHESNKAVQAVMRSDALYSMITLLGSPIGDNRIPGSPSLTLIIFSVMIIGLVLGSAVMKLMNGRSQGEGFRKAMVKLLVAAIGIPLIASAMTGGIKWAVDLSSTIDDVASVSATQDHLNLADWYSLGFPIPPGETIKINKDKEFVLTPAQIEKINFYTYTTIMNEPATASKVKERLTTAAASGNNKTDVIFHKPISVDTKVGTKDVITWDTKHVYDVADKLSLNDPSDPVKIDGGRTWLGADKGTGFEYFNGGSTNMAVNGDSYSLSNGGGTDYGISPISAFNLMNSSFSRNGVIAKKIGGSQITSVAQYVGVGAPNGEALKKLHPIVNVIATFTMIMAALQGMFSILTNGFGGVIAGGTKSIMGSSSGFGQAMGGAIALVGGLFGISVIMSVSFGLLGELQAIITDLFSSASGGVIDVAMDPIREFFKGWPFIGGLLARAAASLVSFVVTLMGALAIPKFGAIPIRVFSEKMAELPGVMADRAQKLENKFTGDYHGGSGRVGGGMGGAGAGSISSQMSSAAAGGKDAGKVLLGAGIGAAASLAGQGLSHFASKKDGDNSEESSLVNNDNNEDNKNIDGNTSHEDAAKEAEAKAAEEQAEKERQAAEAAKNDGTHKEEPVEPPVVGDADGKGLTEITNVGGSEQQETIVDEDVSTIDDKDEIVGDTLEDVDTMDNFKQTGDINLDDTNLEVKSTDINESPTGPNGGSDGPGSITQGGDTHEGGRTQEGNHTSNQSLSTGGNTTNKGSKSDGKTGKSGKSGSNVSNKKASAVTQAFNKVKNMDRYDIAGAVGKGLTAAGGQKTVGGAVKQAMAGVAHASTTAAGQGQTTEGMYNRALNKKDSAKDATGKPGKKVDPKLQKQQQQQAAQQKNNEIAMHYRRAQEEDRRNGR